MMKWPTIKALRIWKAVKLILLVKFQYQQKLLAIGVSAWVLMLTLAPAPTTCAQDIEPQATEGSLDPSFGSGGRVATDFFGGTDIGRAVVLQPDGKIIVAGSDYVGGSEPIDFGLVRYNPDGSVDTSFGVGGKVTTDFFQRNDFPMVAALDSAGKILVAGGASFDSSTRSLAIARYNADGSLDPTFGTGGKVTVSFSGAVTIVNALAIQSDGRVLLVASSGLSLLASHIALARLTTDGSLDSTFGNGGKVTGPDVGGGVNFANGVALQPGGKIVVSGYTGPNTTSADFMLVRYNSDGSVDTTFGTGGFVSTDFSGSSDFARGVISIPGGKLLLFGGATFTQTDIRFAIARYNSDGSLDASFGTSGKVTTGYPGEVAFANAAALQQDGRILLAGGFRILNTLETDFALARYNSDGSVDFSFGTEGRVATDFFSYSATATSIALQPDGNILLAGEVQKTLDGLTDDFGVARYIGTPPTFSLNSSQSTVAAERGAKVKVEILISRSVGFTGAVTVTPPDSSQALKPKPSGPKSTTGNSIVFKLKIKAGAAIGPQQVTFIGRSEDGQVSTATLTLNIQ